VLIYHFDPATACSARFSDRRDSANSRRSPTSCASVPRSPTRRPWATPGPRWQDRTVGPTCAWSAG